MRTLFIIWGVMLILVTIFYYKEVILPVRKELKPENDLSELTIDELIN